MLWMLLGPVAGTALALGIESFGAQAQVLAIRADGSAAVIDTAGGPWRLEGEAPVPAASEWQGCSYVPGAAGLCRTCAGWEETIPLGGFPVTGFALHEGAPYAATFGGGLRRLSGERVAGVPDAVTALAATAGGLLCGTDAGLYRLSGGSVVRLDPAGLPAPHVSALASAGGALWVGSFEGGLASFSSAGWRRWTSFDGLPSDGIDDLAFDGEKLWGATPNGVFWVRDGRVELPENPELRRPSYALFAGASTVFVAQSGRVLAVRGNRVERRAVPEAHPQRVWAQGQRLWVGGLDGLYQLDGAGLSRYGVREGSLPADWVTAVAPWDGGLLVGTYDGGLAHLRPGGRARPVLERAWINVGALAVSGDRVAVGEKDGGLWLHDGGRWTRLRRADGLPSDDVTAVSFDGDDLWVGTRAGLARLRVPRS
ncbi:MAG: hypothetical protein HY554_13675 [Elusimicrobia bacterium]|nr:hypothetical protein [Elusimicrobiota bacterium]